MAYQPTFKKRLYNDVPGPRRLFGLLPGRKPTGEAVMDITVPRGQLSQPMGAAMQGAEQGTLNPAAGKATITAGVDLGKGGYAFASRPQLGVPRAPAGPPQQAVATGAMVGQGTAPIPAVPAMPTLTPGNLTYRQPPEQQPVAPAAVAAAPMPAVPARQIGPAVSNVGGNVLTRPRTQPEIAASTAAAAPAASLHQAFRDKYFSLGTPNARQFGLGGPVVRQRQQERVRTIEGQTAMAVEAQKAQAAKDIATSGNTLAGNIATSRNTAETDIAKEGRLSAEGVARENRLGREAEATAGREESRAERESRESIAREQNQTQKDLAAGKKPTVTTRRPGDVMFDESGNPIGTVEAPVTPQSRAEAADMYDAHVADYMLPADSGFFYGLGRARKARFKDDVKIGNKTASETQLMGLLDREWQEAYPGVSLKFAPHRGGSGAPEAAAPAATGRASAAPAAGLQRPAGDGDFGESDSPEGTAARDGNGRRIVTNNGRWVLVQ